MSFDSGKKVMSERNKQETEVIRYEDQSKQDVKPSFRSILIGLIGVLFLATLNLTWRYQGIRQSFPAHIPLSMIGMAIVFIMLFFNQITRKFLKDKFRFNGAEMVVVYIMVLTAGITLSWSYLQYVVQMPIAFLWVTTTTGGQALRPLLDMLPEWLIVNDMQAFAGFVRGTRGPEAIVPWNLWIRPLIVWASFYFALFWLAMCIGVLIRKRWTEFELAIYPLTYPLLEVIPDKKVSHRVATGESGYYSKKLFYAGIGVTLFIMLWGLIAELTGLLPFSTRYSLADTGYVFRILRGYHPALIGIFYMVPGDVLFSILVFFFKAQIVPGLVAEHLGLHHGISFAYHPLGMNYCKTIGASLVLVAYLLWMSRNEIKVIFKKALGYSDVKDEDDSQEPLSFRIAAIGLVVAVAYIFFFLSFFLQIPMYISLMLIVMSVSMRYIIMARVRAETGLPTSLSGIPSAPLIWLGYDRLGLTGFCHGAFQSIGWGGSTFTAIFLESCSLADKSGLKKRAASILMIVSFLIALAIGQYMILQSSYEIGFPSSTQVPGMSVGSMNWWKTYSGIPPGQYTGGLPFVLVSLYGGIISFVLGFLRLRFIWWPLTPTGFVIGNMQFIEGIWCGVLIAWICKAVLIRYGGARLYKNLMPFFIGLIVGYVIYVVFAATFGFPDIWPLS